MIPIVPETAGIRTLMNSKKKPGKKSKLFQVFIYF